MSVQDGLLSFQMKETIFLSSDKPEIEELRELELLPDLEIRENDYEITICGSLQLRGKYVPTKNANANGGTDTLVSAMRFTPLQLEQGDASVFFSDEEAEIMHRIPLSISVPISRTKEVSDIQGIIDSFDYEIKGPKQLLITADLIIDGIQLKNEREIRAEQQSQKSPDTWEYIQVADDESEEQGYQHVTIDDLERKLTALEKEVEGQLEHQNEDGQELIDEIAHADYQQNEQYEQYGQNNQYHQYEHNAQTDQYHQYEQYEQNNQYHQYEQYEQNDQYHQYEQYEQNDQYHQYEHDAQNDQYDQYDQHEQTNQNNPYDQFEKTNHYQPYQPFPGFQMQSEDVAQNSWDQDSATRFRYQHPQYAAYEAEADEAEREEIEEIEEIQQSSNGPYQAYSNLQADPIGQQSPYEHGFPPVSRPEPPQYAPPYGTQPFYQTNSYQQGSGRQGLGPGVGVDPNPIPFAPPPPNPFQPMAGQFYQQQPPQYPFAQMPPYAPPQQMFYQPPPFPPSPVPQPFAGMGYQPEHIAESPYQATYQPLNPNEYVEESVADQEVMTNGVYAEPVSYYEQVKTEVDIEEKERESFYEEVTFKEESSHLEQSASFELIAEHQETSREPKEAVAKHQETVPELKEAVAKPQETVAEPKEVAAKRQETVPEPKEAVAKLQEINPEPKEAVGKSQETVAEPKEVAVKRQETVPEPKEAVAKLQEIDPEPKEAVAKSQETVAEPKEVAAKRQETVPEPKEAAAKPQEIDPEPKEAVAKSQETVAEPKEVAVKPQDTAREPEEAVAKRQEVAPEPEEAVAKRQEVAPEPKEAIAKRQEVAPEPKEAIAKRQEVALKPKEVATKRQEVTPEPKEVVAKQHEERIENHHSQSTVQLVADSDPYAKYWEGSEEDQVDITTTSKKEAITERATETAKVHVELDENKVKAHTADYDQEQQEPAIRTELSTEEEATVLMAQLEKEEAKSAEENTASLVVEQETEMKVAIGSKNNHKEQNEMMNFSNIFSHLHGNEKNKNLREESKQEEEVLEQTKAKRDTSSSRRDALGNLTSFVQDRTEKFSKLKMCIIQKNDTLDSIAQRYDMSVTKIKEANRMSTDRVEEGQILYIPQ